MACVCKIIAVLLHCYTILKKSRTPVMGKKRAALSQRGTLYYVNGIAKTGVSAIPFASACITFAAKKVLCHRRTRLKAPLSRTRQ